MTNVAMKMDDEMSVSEVMQQLGAQAKQAVRKLGLASAEQRAQALRDAAAALRHGMDAIIEANDIDMKAGEEKGLSAAMLDRLKLDESRIEAIANGLEAIADLPDPLGKVLHESEQPNGLNIQRVAVPLGVIGIIYESRPNVTADAAALCVKSGNAAILRGGSESFHSSGRIAAIMLDAFKKAGLPEHSVQLVPMTDRAAVGEMLTMQEHIDIIVPRGGKGLTERIAKESRIPTIQHLDGNCHIYVHASAKLEKALKVIENAKLRRTGICGALESLVVDEAIAGEFIAQLADLFDGRCEIRGDARAQSLDMRVKAAQDSDWGEEYLDAIVSLKVVSGIEEAIDHVSLYSSGHTDAIMAEDTAAQKQFSAEIDSAIVMINSSTQFADGGEFGMGAEIGISTGRIHARGPVGCDQLTTYKYVVTSDGAVRS